MAIQLQPQCANLEQWIHLAQQAHATFEVLDPFSLSGLGDFHKYEQLAQHYRNTGLAVSLHGTFIDVNPASGDPSFQQLSRQRCRESCEVAVKLGAENVVFHSSAFPFLRGAYLENWAVSCAAFYEELVQSYPVKLFIENAQDLDPVPLRKLMDTVHSDRIGVCLDVGHANYSRAPLEQWLTVLGDRIGYMHLSDNNGAFDDHMPLGKGNVDWQLLDCFWKAHDRCIPVTLETGSIETTMESIRFLREHRYFGLEG